MQRRLYIEEAHTALDIFCCVVFLLYFINLSYKYSTIYLVIIPFFILSIIYSISQYYTILCLIIILFYILLSFYSICYYYSIFHLIVILFSILCFPDTECQAWSRIPNTNSDILWTTNTGSYVTIVSRKIFQHMRLAFSSGLPGIQFVFFILFS